MSRPFRFKRFEIRQARAAMKVGTDGVLLGAWCGIPVREAETNTEENRTQTLNAPSSIPIRILDVGTGTGLIALMVAQRAEALAPTGFLIDALEIDAESYAEAADNVARSPWSDRVTVRYTSLQDYAQEAEAHNGLYYDLIVSNPPYFNDSLLCPDDSRARARHTTGLTYDELAECAVRLLAPGGLLSVILPADQADKFIDITGGYGLCLARRTDILPTPSSPPKRSMMEFSRTVRTATPMRDRLVIETGTRHDYTEQYRALTRDFYLKF